MKQLCLIIALIAALPFCGNAQQKRAFLVGISDYQAHGYKVWTNIHGAEDIKNLIEPSLRKKGFTQISCLINEQATYQKITYGLNAFVNTCGPKDIVYMHFSCHGQPVEDGLKNGYPRNDEQDNWDESLVPIDAGMEYGINGYKGDNHIIDDELYSYIARIRKAIGPQGIVYVVIDACHAGNMERDGFETIRGTNEGLTKKPGNKYNPDEVRKKSRIVKSSNMAPILFVEACESYERNQEIFYQGKEFGALSFNVWQTLNSYNSFPSSINEFKSRLRLNVDGNKEKRNRLWPGTQNLVFED